MGLIERTLVLRPGRRMRPSSPRPARRASCCYQCGGVRAIGRFLWWGGKWTASETSCLPSADQPTRKQRRGASVRSEEKDLLFRTDRGFLLVKAHDPLGVGD